MKIVNLVLVMVVSASLISCGTGKGKKAKVEDEGWVTLFDGTSTEGWRGYNKPAFPEQGWEIGSFGH